MPIEEERGNNKPRPRGEIVREPEGGESYVTGQYHEAARSSTRNNFFASSCSSLTHSCLLCLGE